MRNLKFSAIYFSLLIFLLVGGSLGLSAHDYKPEDITNPNVMDRRVYIADPEQMVSPEIKQRVNDRLFSLRQQTSAEVVVVVLPSIGDMPITEFSEKLFTSWGIGKNDKDNGVLVVIVPEQREAWITTGYGMEGILPDITVKKIYDNTIVANMKEGNLDGAVSDVAAALATVISDPTAADEIRSKNKEVWEQDAPLPISSDVLWSFIGLVVFLLFIFSWIMLIYDSRKLGRMDRYRQALGWHERRKYYVILAILSAGLGIIPFLIANHKYKRSRNKPMSCPSCKGKMHKLNEEEDNNYLNPAQDLEERLNTVDYDVWVCPDCGTIEKYPFRQNQKEYTECPYCHTVARHLVRDHTLVAPTYTRPGIGERIYECKYCNHRDNNRYNIPKKERNDASALAAGAALGALSRGNGGGFGGFGGGFGGGHTGGGGAGGRW